MNPPLVSVITPTWHRRPVLMQRCIPSVERQSWPSVEHQVVSDGPDVALKALVESHQQDGKWPRVRFSHLPDHDPQARWGHLARLQGIARSRSPYVAYLDDDDGWRPDHLTILIDALESTPEADLAYSRMVVHLADGSTARIGDGRLAHGRIATSMIVHRRETLSVATWKDETGAPDWHLVKRWIAAGIEAVSVDAETVDYYPARPIDPAEAVPVSLPPP